MTPLAPGCVDFRVRPRPPTGPTSCNSTTTRNVFGRRLTNCTRATSTASAGRLTRDVEAPKKDDWDQVFADAKKPPQGILCILANLRKTAKTPGPAAQLQSVSRKTVVEGLVTWLSIFAWRFCTPGRLGAARRTLARRGGARRAGTGPRARRDRCCPYQIVLIPRYARSFLSPVTKGTSSAEVVATMIRSAGSPCIGSAKPPAKTAISAETDSILISGRLRMSASHRSNGMLS